jgi:hypothetical protein
LAVDQLRNAWGGGPFARIDFAVDRGRRRHTVGGKDDLRSDRDSERAYEEEGESSGAVHAVRDGLRRLQRSYWWRVGISVEFDPPYGSGR